MNLFNALCQRLKKRSHFRIGEQLHHKLGIHSGCVRLRIHSLRNRRRFCYLSAVKGVFKKFGVGLTVIIQNMRILVGDHGGLSMTGVTLNSLDISAVQLQLVCNARMTQAMEDNLRKVILSERITKDTGVFSGISLVLTPILA